MFSTYKNLTRIKLTSIDDLMIAYERVQNILGPKLMKHVDQFAKDQKFNPNTVTDDAGKNLGKTKLGILIALIITLHHMQFPLSEEKLLLLIKKSDHLIEIQRILAKMLESQALVLDSNREKNINSLFEFNGNHNSLEKGMKWLGNSYEIEEVISKEDFYNATFQTCYDFLLKYPAVGPSLTLVNMFEAKLLVGEKGKENLANIIKHINHFNNVMSNQASRISKVVSLFKDDIQGLSPQEYFDSEIKKFDALNKPSVLAPNSVFSQTATAMDVKTSQAKTAQFKK
jgi:hypothetical protein